MARSTPRSLRALPAVETLLRHPALADALARLPRVIVVEAVRETVAGERLRLRARGTAGRPAGAGELAARGAARACAAARPALRRVLNATGIVLHTNLGRSPLSDAAMRAVEQVSRGYSNLEYDLDAGCRGERGAGVEAWIRRLTGADDALVVNNGAAAILLVLSALAAGQSVLVSRGELVEIGGSFRVPEIMEKSGAKLIEVGTTNRTHLRDFERAFTRNQDIGAILRVHPSNFRIAGFTARPAIEELARLAHRHRVPLIEDLGSGALVDLSRFGLEHEPTARESLTAGCDVVTFSGDKLLGAPQAGLIVGRRRFVGRVKRDALARALRVDKMTLAALEATLASYADPERAVAEVPALSMLAADDATLEGRARRLASTLEREVPAARAEIERGDGEVGGGALPLQRLPGWVVSLRCDGWTARALDDVARGADPPVIGYIRGGSLRLDVRTLTDTDAHEAALALGRALRVPAPSPERRVHVTA